jgi:hypothetical protein
MIRILSFSFAIAFACGTATLTLPPSARAAEKTPATNVRKYPHWATTNVVGSTSTLTILPEQPSDIIPIASLDLSRVDPIDSVRRRFGDSAKLLWRQDKPQEKIWVIGALAPGLPADDRLMLDAARVNNVGTYRSGSFHPIVQAAARFHAQCMADNCCQGHQRFDQRSEWLRQHIPDGAEFREVAAESWNWQSQAESAPEMFHCWRQSPGHWKNCNEPCDFYGYSMAKGRNGIYYGCGIFGKRRR